MNNRPHDSQQLGLDLEGAMPWCGQDHVLSKPGTWLAPTSAPVGEMHAAGEALRRLSDAMPADLHHIIEALARNAHGSAAATPRKAGEGRRLRTARLSIEIAEKALAHFAELSQCRDAIQIGATQAPGSRRFTVLVAGAGTLTIRPYPRRAGASITFSPVPGADTACGYMHSAEVLEAPRSLWAGRSTWASISRTRTSAPTVKAIEILSRLLIVTDQAGRRSRSCVAWQLAPREQWAGLTLTMEELEAAWSNGSLQEGDLRGLVVVFAGQHFAVGNPVHLVDPATRGSETKEASRKRRPFPRQEQMLLF